MKKKWNNLPRWHLKFMYLCIYKNKNLMTSWWEQQKTFKKLWKAINSFELTSNMGIESDANQKLNIKKKPSSLTHDQTPTHTMMTSKWPMDIMSNQSELSPYLHQHFEKHKLPHLQEKITRDCLQINNWICRVHPSICLLISLRFICQIQFTENSFAY